MGAQCSNDRPDRFKLRLAQRRVGVVGAGEEDGNDDGPDGLVFGASDGPANGLDDVLAEFSLVVELDGVYYAMGGNVLLEGPQVAALDGFTVNGAGSVDIDLR